MKLGTTRSPKFRRLSKATGMSTRSTAGTLELLWLFAMEHAPAGDVGKWPNDEIEEVCEWDGEPGGLVSALVECGWLDECAKHRLIIHDWADHLPEFIRLRIKRGSLTLAVREIPGYRPDSDRSATDRRTVAVDREGKGREGKGREAKGREGGPGEGTAPAALGADAPELISPEWGAVVDAMAVYVPSKARCVETAERRSKLRTIAKRYGPTAPVDAVHGYAALHFTRQQTGDFDPRKNFTLDTIWGGKIGKYLDADREAREAGRVRPYGSGQNGVSALADNVVSIFEQIKNDRGASLGRL